MRRILPLLLVGLFLVTAQAGAQTLGTITGEVKDGSGAIIPGASVTVTNTGTNATREMPSNEAGIYTFTALPPGPYVVKSELQGSIGEPLWSRDAVSGGNQGIDAHRRENDEDRNDGD